MAKTPRIRQAWPEKLRVADFQSFSCSAHTHSDTHMRTEGTQFQMRIHRRMCVHWRSAIDTLATHAQCTWAHSVRFSLCAAVGVGDRDSE